MTAMLLLSYLVVGSRAGFAQDMALANRAQALLKAKCVRCHGEKKQESGLDLRSRETILKGGDSGPALVPGKPDESRLYKRVRDGEMPPKKVDRLSPREIATVRQWIAAGAPFEGARQNHDADERRSQRGARHWAWQKPVRPPVPKVELPAAESGGRSKDRSPDANPIDAFVLARLKALRLAPAPLADRRTLIRRATFDLLGLPPAPEQVEKFVSDPDPEAYAKLIDALLAAPQYGERWGRHWLDVARYADTGGYETDIYFKNAWRYRDYVVKSFNDDKPYNIFVQEQIAGDEIWPDDLALEGSFVMPPAKLRHLEARIGTGFYALGPEIHESNMDGRKIRNERLTDWADTTAAAFMGITLGCARCHDHKFDPFTQRDYYGLQAAFAGSKEVETPVVNAMEIADRKQHYPKLIAVDEARRAYRLFERSVAGRKLLPNEEKRRKDLLVAIGQAVLRLPENGASAPGTPFDGLLEIPTATVLGHKQPKLVPTVYLLSRGDLSRPKEAVQPSLPAILARNTGRDAALAGPFGCRKELALWLTQPDHPLTARVMVNRVWAWHFGRGIVATPNDFGKMGQPPTHPELLDWLATEFVARGWSVKELHRLIMLSRTYRQRSDFFTEEHGRIDPDNRFLWRMNRRRLEAESLWDAVHAVAGTLNLKMGGRPVMPPLAPEELTDKAFWVTNADPQEHTRRGLYIIVRRNFRFPLFDIFDAPVNAVSCAGRDVSTVAPQALWLMNNKTAFGQSQAFAARLVREAGNKPESWIDRGWRLALGRSPTSVEMREALALLATLEHRSANAAPLSKVPTEMAALPPARAAALSKLCLALFNLHEFVYID
jgi:mono/diheme cytochrome c family protein